MVRSIISGILAVTAWVWLATSHAACVPPTEPSLPDPATAVTAEMVKAKNDVKQFIADAENYLGCNLSDLQHNSMVDKMQDVADRFNAIVREYKARMKG